MENNNGASQKPRLKLAKQDPAKKPAPPSSPEAAGSPKETPASSDPGDPFAAIRKKKPAPAGEAPAPAPGPAAPQEPPAPEIRPEPQDKPAAPPEPPAPAKEPAPEAPPEATGKENLAEAAPPPPPPPVTPTEGRTGEATTAGRGSHMTSVIVVVVLFLILAGSGAGIWFVLREPGTKKAEPVAEKATGVPEAKAKPVPTNASAPPPQSSEATAEGPVSRARKAVAALEALALPDGLMEENAGAADQPAPAEFDGQGAVPVAEAGAPGAEAPEIPAEPGDPLPAPALNPATAAHKEEVTAFLEKIFIGAVGGVSTNPRAMIDGNNYSRGDLVNESLGLRFVDAKNGTLYFKDEYGIVYVKRF